MEKGMNPRLMLIASMAIFGTLGPFVRNIPVSSGELALYRAILAAVLIAVFLLVSSVMCFDATAFNISELGFNIGAEYAFTAKKAHDKNINNFFISIPPYNLWQLLQLF